jgi:uncharacterized membrane protein YbhN (UPF0104 family)
MRAAARLALAAALLAAIWLAMDVGDAPARLAQADPWLLAAAVALLHAQIVAGALRWRLTAGALGLPLGRRQAVRECYWAMLVNLAVPGSVLGDAARAARTRGPAGLGTAAQAVVLERLSGQIALAALLASLLALWPPGRPWAGTLAAALVLAASAAVLVARIGPRWWTVFADAARRAWLGPDVRAWQALCSLTAAAAGIAAFAACSAAVGAPLGWSQIAVAPLAMLAMLIPASVGGWGWREGAAAALWPLVGHDAAAGFAASVAYGLAALAAAAAAPLIPAERAAGGPKQA